jgi:peptidoglycan/xylan/chitin deacetylase (PgdA/CDA1 family)
LATLLIGYDTESAAVGEGLARFVGPDVPHYYAALDPDTTRRGVALLARLHEELEAPCTFFVCGRTLLHALDAFEPLAASPLFDIQQHTYSHVPFREIVYQPEPGVTATIPETPPAALREELRFSSQLIRDHLGHDCLGLRTPFGYYRGLRGRPDLLEHVRATGLRYVTSWGRNKENANPTPLEVQPFTYEEEGFPDILELPFQFWLDGVWFDQYGYDTGDAYRQAMEGVVDEVARRDVVFGACFHDWTLIAADERRVGWLRGFLAYAKERVPVMTYTEYWRERTGSASRSATCFP